VTAEESFDALRKMSGLRADSMALAARFERANGDVYRFGHAAIGTNVQNELTRDVNRFIKSEIADAELRPYAPGYLPGPGEIVYLSLEENSTVADLIGPVRRPAGLGHFDLTEEFINNLRFFGINASGAKSRVLFLGSYSAKQELTRSGLLPLIFEGGTFNKVRRTTFLFDDKYDCVDFDGYIFIRSVTAFQRMFDFLAQLQAAAQKVLALVNQQIPIENFDKMKTLCSRMPAMATKLANIEKRTYLKTLTMADCERVIKEYGLKIEVVNVAGVKKLKFESDPQRRWLIIRLLDDAFLRSTMTEAKYEANSKVER